jgi:hypothetical protein
MPELNSLNIDPIAAMEIGIAFLMLFLLLYSRRILNLFDLLIFQAISQATCCTLAVYLISQPHMLLQFFCSQAAFTLGILLVKPRIATKVFRPWDAASIHKAETIALTLFLILFAANMVMGAAVGFPIFSLDPSVAKVELYTGGFGIVKRLNESLSVYLFAASLVLSIRGIRRRTFVMVFLGNLLVASLNGSKGSLQMALFVLAFVLARKDLIPPRLRKTLNIAGGWLMVGASAFAITILRIGTGDWITAFQGIALRLLFYGDVVIYYYQPRLLAQFSGQSPLAFIGWLLNSILGMTRLVEYQYPIGNQLVEAFLAGLVKLDTVQGPNALFFVVGHMFFGAIGGVIYCFGIGVLFAKIRSWYLQCQSNSPMIFIALLSLATLVYYLPLEAPLWVSTLVNAALPVASMLGIYSLVQAAYQGWLRSRHSPPSESLKIAGLS